MAEYIEIDAPIDVAVYQRNRRIKVTLRQILESNDAMYERADVRPVVRGRWIDTDNYYQRWKCSACLNHTRDARPPFCPNCGAVMREEQDGR